MTCNSSWRASQFLQEWTLFFPPKYLSLEFRQVKSLSQGRQGLSARLASNMSTTFQWCPHKVISPPSAPATHGPTSAASATEVFCSTSLCFCSLVRWGSCGWQVQLWQNHSSWRDWHMRFRTPLFFSLSIAALLVQAQQDTTERKLSLLCCVLPFASCGQSCTVLIHTCQE